MEYIIIVLFGIFVGIAAAGYMFVDEVDKKERKIANQKAMIINRDKFINDQCKKIQIAKAIIKSDDLYINKIDKIKELFSETNQDK